MIGRDFGRLTVIEQAENDKNRNSRWLCQCTCGNFIIILGMNLRNGSTKSCGCLRYELKKGIEHRGIHKWLERNKPKPELCERCKERSATELSYNNTDSKGYNKNPDDYEWLCSSCHKFKDIGNKVTMTKAKIHRIRELYIRKAATQQELANIFKVNRMTINRIINREGVYSKPINPEILKIFNSKLAERLDKKS